MSFSVYINQTVPSVTDRDIRRTYMYRYFAAKTSQINTTVYEINRREYEKLSDNNFVVLGYLKWLIKGRQEDMIMEFYTGNPARPGGMEPITIPGVLTQNTASTIFLSKKIPAIKSYLRNPLQFYVGE